MIPSPTRAMIVSSVAPPISPSRFVRTVTRARTFNSTPFLAIALSVVWPDLLGSGQSITLGLTLVCTASSTSRPARSMAAAWSNVRGISARWAAINALITLGTLPPARKWASKRRVVIPVSRSRPSPACIAITFPRTITREFTWRRLIPTRLNMLTFALDM